MWIEREISESLKGLAAQYPALVVTGARQVGKSSLLARAFPDHRYVSLDDPTQAELAEHAPQEFLAKFPPPVFVDEVQYAPGLFRYLKIAIDRDRHNMGRFVLTGSQKFSLMQSVSESLAGRSAILELEGLSASEIEAAKLIEANDWQRLVVRGSFPDLWRDATLVSAQFFRSYVATYLERDVRLLLNVGNLRDFDRFIRACAARSGQLLNKSELGRDVGISPTTAGEWLSVLQASGQISLLEPWFGNIGKRLVKSPKLYLNDTGLLCYLLGIDETTLTNSPYRGAVWETFVYSELRKLSSIHSPSLLIGYYRDQVNREVDFLLEAAGRITLIDAKTAEQPSQGIVKSMRNIASFLENAKPHGRIIEGLYLAARPTVDHPLEGARVIHGMRLRNLPQLAKQAFKR